MIEMEIPKDVMSVDTTLVGPLTTRQTVCFGITAVIEYAYYTIINSLNLGLTMDNMIGFGVILALPILAFSFVKPYGLPLEKYIANVFALTYLAPRIRTYQVNNIFSEEDEQKNDSKLKKYSPAELKRHPEYILYK